MITKLPKETEATIQHLIATGEFADSEAVLIQAVKELARRREQAARLRALLQPSIEQVERGETAKPSQDLLDEKWEAALAKYYASGARNDRASS